MRLTREQRVALDWFRDVVAAVNPRWRVTVDAEGWPVVPCRNGRIEWAGDHGRLSAFTTRMRGVFPVLARVPGVERWQTGDDEARVRFAPAPGMLKAVGAVMKPRVRRMGGPGNPEALARLRAARASP